MKKMNREHKQKWHYKMENPFFFFLKSEIIYYFCISRINEFHIMFVH